MNSGHGKINLWIYIFLMYSFEMTFVNGELNNHFISEQIVYLIFDLVTISQV